MRITKLLAPLFTALFALATVAASAAVRPGVEFDYLPRVMPTEAPGRIEVVEFFWYGCPHCNHLEPKVQAWAKTLPKDVVLRREHVMFDGRSDMAGHQKLFVALKAMGKADALANKVFAAIHEQNIELRDEGVLFDWIAKQGINRAQFEAAYKSFGAQAGFARGMKFARDYNLSGVPSFVINGKYITSPSKVGNEDKFFAVINELIAKERAGKK